MLSIGSLAAKLFGTSNDRKVKTFRAKVEAINALEPELEKLSDSGLRARTEDFRRQIRDGATIDDSQQKLQYDLYYVKNHTLFLDMLIMLETVAVVLTGKGAH